jgi:hypothetical protein
MESTITMLSFETDLSTSDLNKPLKFFSAGMPERRKHDCKDYANMTQSMNDLQRDTKEKSKQVYHCSF